MPVPNGLRHKYKYDGDRMRCDCGTLRRLKPDGPTWQYSTDGGVSWVGKPQPCRRHVRADPDGAKGE